MDKPTINPIQLKEWHELHPYNTKAESDDYYVELSNTLFDTWVKSHLTDKININAIRRVSLYVAAYVEDIKSDFGLWKAFITRHCALYGRRLPFFASAADTNASRPQVTDINFIIWYSLQELTGKPSHQIIPPFLNSLTTVSGLLYEKINKTFDKAPCNKHLTRLFSNPQVYKEFPLLKQLLNWFFSHAYLIEPSTQERIMMNHRIIMDKFKNATDEQKNMFMYGIMQDTIFTYPCGPLALYVKDWLHAMADDTAEAASRYLGIEALQTYHWLVTDITDETVTLDCMQRERVIEVAKSTFKDADKLAKGKSIIICGFVKYDQTWNVSGVISLTDTDNPQIKSIKKVADRSRFADVHRKVYQQFMEANNGKPIAFFGNIEEVNKFFTDKLKWPANDNLATQLSKSRNFILFAEEDKGIMIATNIAEYVKDADNPLYKKEEAERKGVFPFINKGMCPIDLLEYLEDNDMLHDACFLTDGKGFNAEKGQKLLHDNWDFIARMFLNEFYWDEMH